MTQTQYLILDELYFVTSFASLANAAGIAPTALKQELEIMWSKGWVKVLFPDPDTEIAYQAGMPEQVLEQCYFLATKAGLLAHNSR